MRHLAAPGTAWAPGPVYRLTLASTRLQLRVNCTFWASFVCVVASSQPACAFLTVDPCAQTHELRECGPVLLRWLPRSILLNTYCPY